MCAYGPKVLGYANREVEAAAEAQRAPGRLLTGPTERMVELAEKLVGLVAHADWAMFQRNGTDAPRWRRDRARRHAEAQDPGGARRLSRLGAVVHAASRPAPPPRTRCIWCSTTTTTSRAWRPPAQSVEGDIAGVIASAFKHDYGKDQELPTPAFARAVRKLCDATGAALILDDVRAGFRLDLGGSW